MVVGLYIPVNCWNWWGFLSLINVLLYFYSGHKLRGEIRGSLRGCSFWDYYIPTYTWFHFSMGWSVGAENFGTYFYGGKRNRKKCFNPSNATQHNHIYTLGADESLAGNANRDLDVSYDDLVISYATIPQHHQASPAAIARGMMSYSYLSE